MRLGVVWVEIERLAIALDRFVVAVQIDKGVAEIVQAFNKLRFEPERLAITCDGVLRVSLCPADDAQQTPDIGIVRLLAQHLSIDLLRLRGIAALVQAPAKRQSLVEGGHQICARPQAALLALALALTNAFPNAE